MEVDSIEHGRKTSVPCATEDGGRSPLTEIGVLCWHHDFWIKIIQAIDGHPDQIPLDWPEMLRSERGGSPSALRGRVERLRAANPTYGWQELMTQSGHSK
jgi:hypothetical protein